MRVVLLTLLAGGALYAQPMTCQRVDTPVATLRAEAVSDLISDVLISCTGGSPAAAGAAVTQYQVLVTSNTAFSNRPVSTPLGVPAMPWNGALLIFDETPGPAQIACAPAGTATTCPVAGGVTGAPNVFQAKTLQDNAMVFQGVPINAPGPGQTRTIRITNLRVNASQIPARPAPQQVTLTTEIFDPNGNLVSLVSPDQVAGVPQPSYQFALRTANDGAVNSPNPALLATPSMLPLPAETNNLAFNLKFSETFPGAFKRRNLGTSDADPTLIVSQATPGVAANTETGFYNTLFPTDDGLSAAGLADSGTRFIAVFTNIPNNVFFMVSSRDVSAGTTNYSDATPRALLTYTDTNGAGPFSQNHPAYGSYSLIQPFNNTVTLSWEVVVTDPTQMETLSFTIQLIAPNGVPQLGTALVQGMVAPVYPGVTTQTVETAPLFPSFIPNPAVAIPAFSLVPSLNVSNLTAVSAASYSSAPLAPDSIVAGFGPNLAPETAAAGAVPPTTLSGITINIIDNSGTIFNPALYMVSAGQINFVLNHGLALGEAVVNVIDDSQLVATGFINVAAVSPALFSADGSGRGIASGQTTNGTAVTQLASYNAQSATWTPVPVDVSSGKTFLALYGTGIRGLSSLANVSLTIGSVNVPVTVAGPDPQLVGLDDVIAGPLPPSLAGKGDVTVALTVDGKTANPVGISLK